MHFLLQGLILLAHLSLNVGDQRILCCVNLRLRVADFFEIFVRGDPPLLKVPDHSLQNLKLSAKCTFLNLKATAELRELFFVRVDGRVDTPQLVVEKGLDFLVSRGVVLFELVLDFVLEAGHQQGFEVFELFKVRVALQRTADRVDSLPNFQTFTLLNNVSRAHVILNEIHESQVFAVVHQQLSHVHTQSGQGLVVGSHELVQS